MLSNYNKNHYKFEMINYNTIHVKQELINKFTVHTIFIHIDWTDERTYLPSNLTHNVLNRYFCFVNNPVNPKKYK